MAGSASSETFAEEQGLRVGRSSKRFPGVLKRKDTPSSIEVQASCAQREAKRLFREAKALLADEIAKDLQQARSEADKETEKQLQHELKILRGELPTRLAHAPHGQDIPPNSILSFDSAHVMAERELYYDARDRGWDIQKLYDKVPEFRRQPSEGWDTLPTEFSRESDRSHLRYGRVEGWNWKRADRQDFRRMSEWEQLIPDPETPPEGIRDDEGKVVDADSWARDRIEGPSSDERLLQRLKARLKMIGSSVFRRRSSSI